MKTEDEDEYHQFDDSDDVKMKQEVLEEIKNGCRL